MLVRFLLCFCLTVQIIQAKTNEELRTWFFRQALECNKEHPVSAEEMQMMQDHKAPTTKNAKCLVNCVFRKANFMDDKGMFDVEGATAESAKNHADDPTRAANSKKLMEICKKVNSESVSDGEAGCDRAILIFKCFNENAPQLGFQLMH